MEDYYTIQTPEHHSALFTQLHSLQKQGVMCDVILAAEDGEVMAHKVILMAVSKYFREKLSPVISATATRVFLKGIPVIELANLVKYIYTGKLLIAKETMDITLEVAEILQLNGVINGYKEILAYEQMKEQPGRENRVVTREKSDKDANYKELNVQVEQFTETAVEVGTETSEEKLIATSFTDNSNVDANITAVVTENTGSDQTSTQNTSADFPFETDLFETQYYDVSVGSSVSVQSENQINTMPSLQKMTNTVSAEGNQSEHQDLLSVAIETLTDANYLSSPPSKEPRHMYSSLPTQAVSYNTSISNAEPVAVSSQQTEPISAVSAQSTILTETTALAQDTPLEGDDIPPANSGSKNVKGHVPVYRVSLPPSVAVYSEFVETRGRPPKSVDEKEKEQPAKSLAESQKSPATRSSKAGKLIVSPQLMKPNQKKKETADGKSPEFKRKLRVAKTVNHASEDIISNDFQIDNRKKDTHLDKVVNDLKTKVAGNVEDFGQSVNFDSDDDDEDEDVVYQGKQVCENTKEAATKNNNDSKSQNMPEKQIEANVRSLDDKKGDEIEVHTSEVAQNSQTQPQKPNVENGESKLPKESKEKLEKPIDEAVKRKDNEVEKQLTVSNKSDDDEPENTTEETVESSVKTKTPEGKNQFIIEIDNAEMDSDGSSLKDYKSSASKRKCKPPRRLSYTDNSKTKGSMNVNIPMVRTRRYSRNENNQTEKTASDGSAAVVKKGNNKIETNASRKSKDIEKQQRDSAKSLTATDLVNVKESLCARKQDLQPVVRLTKQSRKQMLGMARGVAISKSPRKRKLIRFENGQNDSKVVKKKRKQPTELPPVTALKNRQKSDDGDDDDHDKERDNDDDGEHFDDDNVNICSDNIDGTPMHDLDELKCRKCNKIFRYKIQLNKHNKVCKSVNSANKGIGNTFDNHEADFDEDISDDMLSCHSETPESENSITVEVVHFSQHDREDLKTMDQMQEDEGEKDRIYICSEEDCQFTTESPSSAAEHKNTHQGTVNCENCGIDYPSDSPLRNHECILLCDTCGGIFHNQKALSAHKKSHSSAGKKTSKPKGNHSLPTKTSEPKGNRMWSCLICEEVFKTQKMVKEHEKSHELVCSCCNFKFTRISSYQQHINSQNGRMCFICNRPFSRRSDQRKHMFKFHGVPIDDGKKDMKMFKCDICSFIAWSERTYKLHKKSHTGVKDVPCPKCKKMFMSQYDVNRHLKTVHNSARPGFSCEHEGCTYVAGTMKCLRTHVRLRHDTEKEYLLCQFCEYKSPLKGNLDKHIRKVHDLEIVSKPFLKDMDKYGELKHGTIITKDGKEVTEEDIENYKKSPGLGQKSTSQGPKIKKAGVRGRPKTIEEFTQEVMARHMKRLEQPPVEKDFLSPTLQKAIKQPAFPGASVAIRREIIEGKGIITSPRFKLQYDKMDEHEAHQYALRDEVVGLDQEVLVDDGIVSIPSAGMPVGDEVYIIEAGKSDNIIESNDFVQNFVEECEDETTKSLRVLTNNSENEDETSRSLRVLTTLLEAGQHS